MLYAKPLWQGAPPWRRDEWQAFKTTLTAPDMANGEWGVWIEWYESITQGHPAFNLKNRQTADVLERRIALGDRANNGKFNKEFWNREPGEINREIAEWVAEARAAEVAEAGIAPMAMGDIELPQQTLDATMFGLDAAGRISRIAVPPEQRLLITQQQQAEYEALRGDAADFAAKGQILGKLGAEVAALFAALPEDMTHARVFDIWRAINRLRRSKNAHVSVAAFPEPHEAKLEPAMAAELEHLLNVANIFAFGDPGLRRRDELSIPPQDKQSLAVEKALGDGLADAALQTPELFTEDALQSVAAEESNAFGAGNDPHGQQAIDQTNKTRRNWLAAMLAGLKTERGFAWKEMRGGAYKKTGEAAIVALGVAVSDAAGITAVYPAIWRFASANAASFLTYVKTVFQNPTLTAYVEWALKTVSL